MFACNSPVGLCMLFSGARAVSALVADLENVAYILLDLTLCVIAAPLTKAVWT